MDILLEQITIYVEQYGVWVILVLGILHPFIAFPAHIFVLSVAIQVLGIFDGFLILLSGNLIGIILFYILISKFRCEKKQSERSISLISKTYEWIKKEASWKHIVVLGAPLIPTQPLKYMLALSGMKMKKYLLIEVSAYILLFLSNSLLYFGVLSFITDELPIYLGVILVILFVVFVYFGNYIFKKISVNKENKSSS